MNLAELFLLLASCCGITFTIVHAEIMNILGIRQFLNQFSFFKKLIKCSLCTGFWVGLLVGLCYVNLQMVLPFCFASSACCFLYDRTTILLDEKILKLENESTRKHNQPL